MKEPLGPTGRSPRGKLNADDKGELRIGVAADRGNVVIDFGTRVSWVGMPPEQAEQLAETLRTKAREARVSRS